MNGRPLVSVHMAVKNGRRFLGQALDSVFAQSYDNVEVVVVDGGSTDGSVELAESYPGVRCLAQQGTGFAGAWNEAVEASAGPLLAFIDSDDRWGATKLERQVALLTGPDACDLVVTNVRFVLEPGTEMPPGFRPSLLNGAHLARMPSALMIRRNRFERVGPFRTDFTIASDIEWFSRAHDLGLRLGVVEEELVHKRVHDSNLSYFEAQDLNAELLRLLRESVQRRTPS